MSLQVLDYVRGSALDRPGRGWVLARCSFCGVRKWVMSQQRRLQQSCGCINRAPVSCPHCSALVTRKGLAGHVQKAHGVTFDRERVERAHQLRAAGALHREIAEQLGMSRVHVTNILNGKRRARVAA